MRLFRFAILFLSLSSVVFGKDKDSKMITLVMPQEQVSRYHKRHDEKIKNVIKSIHQRLARSGELGRSSKLLQAFKKYQQKKTLYVKTYAVDASGNRQLVTATEVPQYHGLKIPVTFPDMITTAKGDVPTKYIHFEVSPIDHESWLKESGYQNLIITHEHPFKKIHAGSKHKITVSNYADQRYLPKSK